MPARARPRAWPSLGVESFAEADPTSATTPIAVTAPTRAPRPRARVIFRPSPLVVPSQSRARRRRVRTRAGDGVGVASILGFSVSRFGSPPRRSIPYIHRTRPVCGHTTARARRADGHRARAPPLDASPRASVAREGRRRFLSRARLAQSRAVAETRGKTRGKTREAVVRSFVGASTDGSSPPTTMEERAVSSAHASPSSTERTIAPERVFERCRDAARALEVAALGEVSHREKC